MKSERNLDEQKLKLVKYAAENRLLGDLVLVRKAFVLLLFFFLLINLLKLELISDLVSGVKKPLCTLTPSTCLNFLA